MAVIYLPADQRASMLGAALGQGLAQGYQRKRQGAALANFLSSSTPQARSAALGRLSAVGGMRAVSLGNLLQTSAANRKRTQAEINNFRDQNLYRATQIRKSVAEQAALAKGLALIGAGNQKAATPYLLGGGAAGRAALGFYTGKPLTVAKTNLAVAQAAAAHAKAVKQAILSKLIGVDLGTTPPGAPSVPAAVSGVPTGSVAPVKAAVAASSGASTAPAKLLPGEQAQVGAWARAQKIALLNGQRTQPKVFSFTRPDGSVVKAQASAAGVRVLGPAAYGGGAPGKGTKALAAVAPFSANLVGQVDHIVRKYGDAMGALGIPLKISQLPMVNGLVGGLEKSSGVFGDLTRYAIPKKLFEASNELTAVANHYLLITRNIFGANSRMTNYISKIIQETFPRVGWSKQKNLLAARATTQMLLGIYANKVNMLRASGKKVPAALISGIRQLGGDPAQITGSTYSKAQRPAFGVINQNGQKLYREAIQEVRKGATELGPHASIQTPALGNQDIVVKLNGTPVRYPVRGGMVFVNGRKLSYSALASEAKRQGKSISQLIQSVFEQGVAPGTSP